MFFPSDSLHRVRERGRSLLALVGIQLVFAQAVLAAGPATLGAVLYDQSDVSMLGGASPTQQMSAGRKDEIADDFEVTAPNGWVITDVMLDMAFTDMNTTPPGQPPYMIAFYRDENGHPAAVASCQYDEAPGVTDYPGNVGIDVSVSLPAPCVLLPGRYWMAMSVVLDPPPYSLWGYNAPAVFILSEPVYRNPDNSWGTGCVSWRPAYSNHCLFNPAGGKPNMVFQLIGTVGMGDQIFADRFELTVP